MCFHGLDVNAQNRKDKLSCVEDNLEFYADSLKNFLLAHQTSKTFILADSLLHLYGHLDCAEVLRIKSAKANAYELTYRFEPALEIYNEIDKIAQDKGYVVEEAGIKLSLARVYEWVGRPEICEKYLNEAKVIIDANALYGPLSRYYVRAASYQRIFKDRTLAREYASKAIDLGQKYGIDRSIGDGYLVLGMVTDDFSESAEYFKRSSDQFFSMGDEIGSMFQRLNFSKKYLERGELETVFEIVQTAEDFAERLTDNDRVLYRLKISIAEIKAVVYDQTGDKDEVIDALKQKSKYSGLLGEIVNQEKINELVLDNTVTQEKERAEWSERLSKLLGIGLLVLTGIILFLLRLFSLNKRKNEKIKQQTSTITSQYTELENLYNYQTTLLSEVHHRIKNNLQLIISLITLQKSKLDESMDEGIMDMLSHRITSIALIHEQLYNLKEFEKVDVELYVTDLLKNFMSLISEKNIEVEYDLENIQLNLETITPLGLIWSELISNSLKYNQEREELKIYFDLIKKGDMYSMNYYDNGVGYPDGQFAANEMGMGFTIINSLSRQLSSEIKTFNSNGAHFSMDFKEKTVSPL